MSDETPAVRKSVRQAPAELPIPQAPVPPQPAPEAAAAKEVGSALAVSRAARGDSVESVCRHTRIPRKFIEALEAGRFEELPAPVYLRSFLTGYCEYLEIPLAPLWDRLHPAAGDEAPATEKKHVTPAPEESHRTPTQFLMASGTAALPGSTPHLPSKHSQMTAGTAAPCKQAGSTPEKPVHSPLEKSPYLTAFVDALGAILFSLALAAALVVWIARARKAEPAADDLSRPQALQPLRPAVDPKLGIVFRDEAWIRLTVDGAVMFEGRAPKGARQQWPARKAVILRTAQPGNLELTLNDAAYQLPRPEAGGEYRIASQ